MSLVEMGSVDPIFHPDQPFRNSYRIDSSDYLLHEGRGSGIGIGGRGPLNCKWIFIGRNVAVSIDRLESPFASGRQRGRHPSVRVSG